MFQHTLDRSDQIIAPERRITLIAQDHGDEARSQLSSRPEGKLILQPSNRETAVGIFLGLTYVRTHDPDGTVLILPSDHFIYPEDTFLEMASSLARAARDLKQWIFLLGACPDYPEPDYGWIQPGTHLGWIEGYHVRRTLAFAEKPNLARCKAAMRAGALWNTMVTAAKVETLWNLGWHCFPDMMSLFEMFGDSIGTGQEDAVLQGIYDLMPSRSFSFHFLRELPNHIAVMELEGVLWSDWGRPERIAETLRQIGREPAFCHAQIA
jgi:mannose-1-phosphate guanylyltransferase